MYSDTDFTPDERAMLAELEKNQDQPANTLEQQQGAPDAGAQAAQSQAATHSGQAGDANDGNKGAAADANNDAGQGQQGQASADPGEQQPGAQDKKPGDLRNALRASRRAERAAREDAERLRRENEELKTLKASQPDEDELSEAEIAKLEEDFPSHAAVMRKLNERVKKIATAAPAAEPTRQREQQEFIPPLLVPELQEVVDDIPDLLDIQNDPDQTRWHLAVQADALLTTSPKWKDKSLAERLAEAARIANEEAGIKPVQPASSDKAKPSGDETPLEKARKRIEQVAETPPASISDLRGGASPVAKTAPDYSRMSDDEIMSSLG